MVPLSALSASAGPAESAETLGHQVEGKNVMTTSHLIHPEPPKGCCLGVCCCWKNAQSHPFGGAGYSDAFKGLEAQKMKMVSAKKRPHTHTGIVLQLFVY